MIQLTGAEFKRFYDDPDVWPKDSHWEDGAIIVNGSDFDEAPYSSDTDKVPDDATVQISDGDIVGGSPKVPPTMELAVPWWRARQVAVEYIVSVPKDKVAVVLALLESHGAVARKVG
jgi:hypothetical protein